MPECHIMQGVPGSGKSTYAQRFLNICSADTYHMVDGVYRWKPENAGMAHRSCMKKFLMCTDYLATVCVDNTNTTVEEMVPYVMVAQALGFDVTVHTFECDVETAAARNTHGVPTKSIERMAARMRNPPKKWGVTHIIHPQEEA